MKDNWTNFLDVLFGIGVVFIAVALTISVGVAIAFALGLTQNQMKCFEVARAMSVAGTTEIVALQPISCE